MNMIKSGMWKIPRSPGDYMESLQKRFESQMWVSGVGGPKLLFITVFMAYFTTFLLTIFGKVMLKVPSLWGRWVSLGLCPK